MSLNLTILGRRVVTVAVAICCMAIAAGAADKQENFISTAQTSAEAESSAPCLTGLCPIGAWAVCEYNGDLYAGGQFTSADGQPALYIARWDETQWHDVGGGMNPYVNDLIVYDNRLIAGGVFDSAGGIQVNHIAAWDGISWAPLGDCIKHKQGRRDVYHRAQRNALHIPKKYLGRRGNEISI